MTKKELILEKALFLFANEGYESSGVARIVEEAGVTKPTLYHYFGNKEGLLKSIYEKSFSVLIDRLKGVFPYEEDVIMTLQALTLVYINFAKEYEHFFWLSKHLRKGPLKSESYIIVRPYHVEEETLVSDLFYSISKHHTNLKGNEEFLMMNYLSIVNGYIEMNILSQTINEVDQVDVHKLTKQFLYGIFSL